MKRSFLLALIAVPLLIAAARPEPKVSYKRDIQPIFDEQCVMCHNSLDPHSGLVLDAGLSHSQLVGMNATEAPDMARVAPRRPDQSYLFRKISNTHLEAGGKGWWMPPPTQFFSAVIPEKKMLIRKWIEQGALDN